MLGKKMYKSSMLNVFRLVILAIVIFFLNDFILTTYTYEKFQLTGGLKIVDVLNYHFRYPREFISFFLLIIVPAFYYAFIRGVRFYEKGLIYNRGVPFMNKTILYNEIEKYKLLHPRHVVTIHTHKKNILIIADNSIQRIIALLDQHNIQGDLARDDYVSLISNFRKFIFVVLAFTVVVFLMIKFGLFAR